MGVVNMVTNSKWEKLKNRKSYIESLEFLLFWCYSFLGSGFGTHILYICIWTLRPINGMTQQIYKHLHGIMCIIIMGLCIQKLPFP